MTTPTFETVLDNMLIPQSYTTPEKTGDDVRAMYKKQGLVLLELSDDVPDGYTFYGPSPELIEKMGFQLMFSSKWGRKALQSMGDRQDYELMNEWIKTKPSFKIDGKVVHLYNENDMINSFIDSEGMLYDWKWAFIGLIFEKHGQLAYADRKPSDSIISSLNIVYATSGRSFLLPTFMAESAMDCCVRVAKMIWNEFGIPTV